MGSLGDLKEQWLSVFSFGSPVSPVMGDRYVGWIHQVLQQNGVVIRKLMSSRDVLESRPSKVLKPRDFVRVWRSSLGHPDPNNSLGVSHLICPYTCLSRYFGSGWKLRYLHTFARAFKLPTMIQTFQSSINQLSF
uniref:Uncharacterized protein n=1 Tax=Opuntia streptacantha TaxID=393608 RepID=A0A7C9EI18_OPUST